MKWLKVAAHPLQGKIIRALNARLVSTWKRLWNELVNGQMPEYLEATKLVDQLADGIMQSMLTFNQDIGGVIVQVKPSPQNAFHALYSPTQPKPTMTLFIPNRETIRTMLWASRGSVTPILNEIRDYVAHELVHHEQGAAGQLHGTAKLPEAEYYADNQEFEAWTNYFLKRLKGRTPKYIRQFITQYFSGMQRMELSQRLALADRYTTEVLRRMGL